MGEHLLGLEGSMVKSRTCKWPIIWATEHVPGLWF